MSKVINFNLKEFLEEFQKTYMDLYNNWQPADYRDLVQAFDRFVENESNAAFVGEFAFFRGDFISSDREAAAFMATMKRLDAAGKTEETEVEEPDLPIPVPATTICYTTEEGGAEVAMFDTDDPAKVLELFAKLLLESEPTLVSVDSVSH